MRNIGLVNLIPDEDAPPMSLVYLGTYLQKNGFRAVILDPTYNRDALEDGLAEPDIIGISAMTTSYMQAVRLAQAIRKKYRKPIIVGGAHISLLPQSLAEEFTAGVIGEGEEVAVNLCNALQAGLHPALAGIPGIVHWADGQRVINPAAGQIPDLDVLPDPDFSLLDPRYFKKRWIDWSARTGTAMHISTSRGCPYDCIFCSGQRIWKKVRLESARRIFSQIRRLVKEYRVDHIVIDDDLFLSNRQRVQDLAGYIEGSDIAGKAAFLCSGRANLIDEQMCALLKKMGIRTLNFGFESGSDRMLGVLKGDNVTVSQNKTAIKLCRQHGLEVSGNLIIGSPQETLEDMRQTIEFMEYAIKMGCYKVGVFVMTPLPGTPIWQIAKDRGLVTEEMDWDRLSFYDYAHPMLLDPGVDRDRFADLFKSARDTSYRGWLKNRWRKMLRNDFRRVWRKVAENPGRAAVMAKNIFMQSE